MAEAHGDSREAVGWQLLLTIARAEGVRLDRRRGGWSKDQILAAYLEQGAEGLLLQTPGPKTDYRRTGQVVRLVIRCRFLDPDSSPEVIAQKIRQQSHTISQRSVERIIADYGLQKKTLHP